MDTANGNKHILLVGAGLPNLLVATQAGKFHALGASLTLLDIDPFWFSSNMAAGVISGIYGLKDFHLDLRLMARQSGLEFIQDEVVSLLPEKKKVMTRSGRMLEYTCASFAIGSQSVAQEGEVPAEGRFPVKPVKNVLQIRNEIETILELMPDKVLEVAILGAGPSGLEYALNLADFLRERKPKTGWHMVMVESQSRVLPGFVPKASQAAEKMLRACDVKIRTGVEILHIQSNRLVLAHSETLSFDVAVVALGQRVSDLFLHSGLDTDEHGALRVESTLNVGSYPEIFGSGDCARVKRLPPLQTTSQAYAQAAVLVQNLLSCAKGKAPAIPFHGAGNAQLISLGKSHAMWVKGSQVWQGTWLQKYKQWQDQKLMRRVKPYHT